MTIRFFTSSKRLLLENIFFIPFRGFNFPKDGLRGSPVSKNPVCIKDATTPPTIIGITTGKIPIAILSITNIP
ncbi:hypothetical protein D3C76_1033850 [compost metagenome]